MRRTKGRFLNWPAVFIGTAVLGCGEHESTGVPDAAFDIGLPPGPTPNITWTGAVVSQWAPVVLQDVDDGFLGENSNGAGDHIARVDFDGDWIAHNNWNNGYRASQTA